MSDKKMRKSTVTVLAAFGVLALIVVLLVGMGRIAVSHMVGDADGNVDFRQIDFSDRTTTTFDVEDFRGITFMGSWKVDLVQGDEWLVELTYPRSLEREIEVETEGDQLILNPGTWGNNWNWNWWGGNNRGRENRLSARIVMPELDDLNIMGASDMDMSGFEGDELTITISGAGNIEGDDGHYQELTLIMSGAGNVDFRDMKFVDAKVVLSGAGNVKIGMDGGDLSGNLSGFGNIEYYGKVDEERVNVAGWGKVRQRN